MGLSAPIGSRQTGFPTCQPSLSPTANQSRSSGRITGCPTLQPSASPTIVPIWQPSTSPTLAPSRSSGRITDAPTGNAVIMPNVHQSNVSEMRSETDSYSDDPSYESTSSIGSNTSYLNNSFDSGMIEQQDPIEEPNNPNLNDYIIRMSELGESGDNITLMAAANHYGVAIVVHDVNQPELSFRFDPTNNQVVTCELQLVFSPGHYMQYNPNGDPIERGGDGNCQFSSIAAELHRVGLMASDQFQVDDNIVQEYSHMNVREAIINEIFNHSEHYQDFIVADDDL